MHARFAQIRFSRVALRFVKSSATGVQAAAVLLDWYGLLLQLPNNRIDHFVSRAKKAEVFFFKIVTSCRSCWFSSSNWTDPLLLGGARFADAWLALLLRTVLLQPAPDRGLAAAHAFTHVLDALALFVWTSTCAGIQSGE